MKFNLEQALFMKGVEKPNTWLRQKAGLTPQAAHRLMKSKVRNLELKTLEKICIGLYCTPNDLVQWIPDGKVGDIPGHPLQVLKPRPMPNVSERIKKLNTDQLLALDKIIDGMEGAEWEGWLVL